VRSTGGDRSVLSLSRIYVTKDAYRICSPRRIDLSELILVLERIQTSTESKPHKPESTLTMAEEIEFWKAVSLRLEATSVGQTRLLSNLVIEAF